MALIDDAAVYEVTVRGSAANQAILNVFHYRREDIGPIDPGATEENFLDQFRTNWRAAVLPKLWNGYFVVDYTLKRITGTEVNPAAPPPNRLVVPFQFQLPGGINDAGGRPGEPLPTYSAVGYRKRTNNPTRNGRGSFRLSVVMEEDTTGGNSLNAGALLLFDPPTLETIRRVLIAAGGNEPMIMVVFSETLALAAVNTVPEDFAFDVTALTLNPFITTQNTRKQRVGIA